MFQQRLDEAKQFFGNLPFITIEGDGWSSQGGTCVFAVCARFFQPSLGKAITVLLEAKALKKGKSAAELEKLVKHTLQTFGNTKAMIIQSISDEEKAVQNCFLRLEITGKKGHDSCLAHVLQTALRHALGFSRVPFKTDPFPVGHKFYIRVLALNAYFSKAFMKQRQVQDIVLQLLAEREWYILL